MRVVDYDDAIARHGSVVPALLEAADVPDVGADSSWLNSRSPRTDEARRRRS